MDTFNRLRRHFARVLGMDEREIAPETPLRTLLGWGEADDAEDGAVDSLDQVELTMFCEELADQGGLRLPEADPDTWLRLVRTGTLRDLADFIDRGSA
ncbi:MAG: acyl carrier protein [Armatimonadota bacterium]